MADVVLVLGATGWLGKQITEELLATGLSVRLGMRDGAANAKASTFDGRADIVAADLHDEQSLADAVQGVHTIVSCVLGGTAEIVDGQAALARAGLAAGVKRILPSDFAVDLRGVSADRNLFLGWRAEADRQIAEIGLPQANILNGTFTEKLGDESYEMVDTDASQIAFYGDADQPYDFTATPDVARFVAAVVKDLERVGPQMVLTDRITARDLADIATDAFGRPFTLRHRGDLDQLEKDLAERHAKDPDNPMAWVNLQYQRMMITGEGALALPISTTFLDTPPQTVAQYLAGMSGR